MKKIPEPSLPGFPQMPYDGSLPIGSVVAFAGKIGTNDDEVNIELFGWTICDGRELNIIEYPELYAVLRNHYGGDGQKTFKVPDYRGYFLRGIDSSKNPHQRDKDIDKRTAANPNPANPNAGKDEVGSTQEHALQFHEHFSEKIGDEGRSVKEIALREGTKTVVVEQALTGFTYEYKGEYKGPSNSLDSPPGDVKVSINETRPYNVYVNYIIKYTYPRNNKKFTQGI